MSKWIGPFRVHRVGPGGTYQLVTPDGVVKEDLVHRDRLKRCLENEESIPNGLWSDETLEGLDDVFDGAGAGYLNIIWRVLQFSNQPCIKPLLEPPSRLMPGQKS
jgi:hypothetical protein